MVFALRGARIVGADKRGKVDSLTLADQRPAHRAWRCVIGVSDPVARKLSAYKASTVCNANSVLSGFQSAQHGVFEGNVLATGCYTYTVGTHNAGQPREIRGVLRLSQSATGTSTVVVLRTINDVICDRWDSCAPADNFHPARRLDGFSSLGCLTLPGTIRRRPERIPGFGRTFGGHWAWARFSSIRTTSWLGNKTRFRASDHTASERPDTLNIVAEAGSAVKKWSLP